MEKKWLRPWFAKEELLRCVDELKEVIDPEIGLIPADYKPAIKTILANWRKRIKEKDYAANRKASDAGDIGTQFHDLVEHYLKGETVFPSGQLIPMFSQFMSWADQFNPRPIGLEQHVVSKKWMYGGTFDFIGTTMYNCTPNGLTIADWKTSNKIDDTFGLQLAAYAYAYGEQNGWTEEETWDKIKVGVSVRIDKRAYKDNELEVKVYQDLPYLFRVFNNLREPHDYLYKVGIWEAELEPQEA